MDGKSLWSITERRGARGHLPGNIKTHTAIIGGGMAGILTAYALEQKGIECIVLEEGVIGCGQTENTTAKITSQHNLIYSSLIENVGKEKARMYAEANQKAIETYRGLIRELRIDCDFTDCRAYLYTRQNTGPLQKEYEAARELGLPAGLTTDTELPFPVLEALYFENQARFHPVKFLKAVAGQVTVYENTAVREVEDYMLVTDYGKVEAENIVFAAHYPFINVPGYYFLKMHQERSYVAAVGNAQSMQHMYLGIDKDGLSFRSAGDKILVGGGGHRTGENLMGGQYKHILRAARDYWPDCEEAARWSAQDCMTLDGIPYIGKYGHHTKSWYVATGFGKWGMTSSMVSALIISDFINGKENPYAEVFSPQRANIKASAGNIVKEGGHAVAGLAGKAEVPEDKKRGNLSMRCPHLGCQLTWNPEEESYDCPCHGSRFDNEGNKIDGPARQNMKLKETKI